MDRRDMIKWAAGATAAISAPASFKFIESDPSPLLIVITVDDPNGTEDLGAILRQFNETVEIGPDKDGRYIPVVITTKDVSIDAVIDPRTQKEKPKN